MINVPGLDSIVPDCLIPHTKGGDRKVTHRERDKIWMKIGPKAKDKYTTVEWVGWMYDQIITYKKKVDRGLWEKQFPEAENKGTCIFSMTGGILVKLRHAKCKKCGGSNYYEANNGSN
jgi:hypothetical protein